MIPSPTKHHLRFCCPVFEPGDPGHAAEVATFHLNTVHTPDVVVGAEDTTDVVDAIRLAREFGYQVAVQSCGHGAVPVTSGLLITMHRMNSVSIDPVARIATIGGGARWTDVLTAAHGFGLMPIIGSSPHVGVVGYLLGGGLSPLARSHGFSSDYVESFTVVTAAGEAVTASATEHADLFWSLRGGKTGLGVVTEVRLRLVEQSTLYGGSLVFTEDQIEPVLRGWIDWTHQADEMVTTSVAVITVPDVEFAPPPFRGKRMFFLRFAYPGDEARGAELAAPLRALAPIFLDDLGQIPANEFGRIHNDPIDPMPMWGAGAQFTHLDQEFATRWLARFGVATDYPFAIVELRHGGGALLTDVPGGSAATGRECAYTMFLEAIEPPAFETIAPAATAEMLDAMQPWLSPEANVNFIGESAGLRAWTPETQARLDETRAAYDPERLFVHRW
jgi:FAD/FMN-containing dehydrogenase